MKINLRSHIRIRKDSYPLGDDIKERPVFLFIKILVRTALACWVSLITLLVLSGLIAVQLFAWINPDAGIYLHNFRSMLLVILAALFFFIPFALAREEFAHAAAAIQKGKKDYVHDLQILSIVLEPGNIRLSLVSAAIQFKGRFSALDIIHISAAGPLYVLMIIAFVTGIACPPVLFLANNIIHAGEAMQMLQKCILLSCFIPLNALLPYRFHGETDGHRILRVANDCSLPAHLIILESLRGALLPIKFLVGSARRNPKII